jgi:putative nucleotidyltransferase with HDIG domain
MERRILHNCITNPDTPPDWDALRALDWWQAMAACPQDVIHHAEGDVATHTRMVVEEMLALPAFAERTDAERAVLLLAALLHDIGKPDTTREEDGRITARGHSVRGEVMTRRLLWTNDIPFALREQVTALIRFHQHPFWLIEREDAKYQALRISQSARCDLLAILAEADMRGRICADRDAVLLNVACFREFCEEAGCLSAPYPFASDHSRFLYFRSGGERDPAYHAYETGEAPTLILMSGLPGVGKDTYVRRHLVNLPCVSLDDIRAEIGVSPSDNQEPVLAVARERARQYLRHGESMVWNATNLSRELRTRRLSFADDYRARVRLIYVEVPAAVQRAQNKNRPARVPDNAMERIFRQWEMPDLTEAHTLELAIRDAGEKC